MFHPTYSIPSTKNLRNFGNYGNINNAQKNNILLSRPTINSKELPTDMSSVTHQQFTKQIVPAPYSKLSPNASDSNIVDSIFTQSQVY